MEDWCPYQDSRDIKKWTRFTARGLPPESQGCTCEDNGIPWHDAPDCPMRSVLAITAAEAGEEAAPAPQPAEPCAQGAADWLWRVDETRGIWQDEPEHAFLGFGISRIDAEQIVAGHNQAAAAKDARIAELEAERDEWKAEFEGRTLGFRSACREADLLQEKLSEVTRERDAWKIKRDLVFTGYKRVLTRAAELERERNSMRGDRNIAIRAAREAQSRLAASETDRGRLRAALGIASNVFDEMDAIAWDDDSGWQSSSYEDAKDAVNAALATEGDA